MQGLGEHLVCSCRWSFHISQESSRAIKHNVFQDVGCLVTFPHRAQGFAVSLEPLRLVAGPWYRSDQGFTDSVGLQQSPESVGRQKIGGGGGTQGEAGKSGS